MQYPSSMGATLITNFPFRATNARIKKELYHKIKATNWIDQFDYE